MIIIHVVWNSLLFAVGFSPVYLFVSAYSLVHHARIYNASPRILCEFLDKLRFPFDIVFVHPRFNIFKASSGKTPVEFLTSDHLNYNQIGRYVSALLSLIVMLAVVVGLSRQTEIYGVITHISYLFINSLGLFGSWRFGRKLKHMMDVQAEED